MKKNINETERKIKELLNPCDVKSCKYYSETIGSNCKADILENCELNKAWENWKLLKE